MMQAAKDAVCHDFIMRLPKGYDASDRQGNQVERWRKTENHIGKWQF